MDLTFQKYALSNGITLIVKENHVAQSVVVRGRLPGGTNLDPDSKLGLTAFATSLMRRGTSTRSFAQINDAVESIGASVHMGCGRHLTTFGSKSLAEDFDLLIELLVDIMRYPAFPADEAEKMRGQIITGLKELEDSPRGMAQHYFRQTLYGLDHPYGRSFNGTLESVPTLNRDDLAGFYKLLHPQDGLMVVVGDINGQTVFNALEASLGQWRPDPIAAKPALPVPTPLTEMVRHIHAMPDKSQVDIVLGNSGPSRLADDFYAASVGDTIFGQLGLGGRIGRAVRDESGMAYYARTALSGGLGPAPWYIYAGVSPTNVDEAIEIMLAEIRRFREETVTDQELSDAKSYMTGILPLQMESNEGVAGMLLQMQLFDLGDDFIRCYPEIINRITKNDVQAAARNYLSDEIYALSIAGPYGK